MATDPVTVQNDANDQYNAIRNNADTSAEGKIRAMAKLWVQTRDTLATIQSGIATDTVARRQTLERKLYGLPLNADASTVISYRDALDRASRVDQPQEAIDLLNRASTSGDEILTRAVLARGFDMAWPDVVNAHNALYPSTEADAEELWTLNTAPAKLTIAGFGWDYISQKPVELARYDDYRITQIAAGTGVAVGF